VTRDRNALQHTATHCNILQLRGERQTQRRETDVLNTEDAASHCNTLQHTVIRDSDTAKHCNTLRHSATHCNTVQHSATQCDTRQRHCKTLQHAATHRDTRQRRCNTLQHTATHCNAQWYETNTPWQPQLEHTERMKDTYSFKMADFVAVVVCCEVSFRSVGLAFELFIKYAEVFVA